MNPIKLLKQSLQLQPHERNRRRLIRNQLKENVPTQPKATREEKLIGKIKRMLIENDSSQ